MILGWTNPTLSPRFADADRIRMTSAMVTAVYSIGRSCPADDQSAGAVGASTDLHVEALKRVVRLMGLYLGEGSRLTRSCLRKEVDRLVSA